METIVLNGENLTTEKILRIHDFEQKVEVDPIVWERVQKSRDVVDDIVKSGRTKYGINTGIGTKFRFLFLTHFLNLFLICKTFTCI